MTMTRSDIVNVYLPQPSGQQGHEQHGLRPVVIVQSDTNTFGLSTTMIVPLTGNLKASKFPYHFFVDPSQCNGLSKKSVVLVSQLRAIDKSRVGAKIGVLESEHMLKLETEIGKLLGLCDPPKNKGTI